jgi:cell division septum initiation protein DivIVA
LAPKKESRNNYFHIEHWNIANQSQQLDSVKDSYSKVKQETENLTQQAMNLKESFKTGAIDSINKAATVSDEASLLLESLESKIDTELKPILKALEQKIESSKENFELSDNALKNYYSSVMSNLTKAMSDISFLNGEVSSFLLYINLNKNVGLLISFFFI